MSLNSHIMVYDLFSSRDFCYSNMTFLKVLVWSLGSIWIIWQMKLFFSCNSRLTRLLSFLLKWHREKTKANIIEEVKGSYILFSGFFLLILGMNVWGLFPYVFGITTQFVLTIRMSLVIWLGIVMSSINFSIVKFLRHLTPQGSPAYLAPILNLIELMRKIIRPLTLALRLRINMTTGHVLIALMRTRRAVRFFRVKIIWIILVMIIMGYIIFELGICFIQGFVFRLLRANYLGEHT